MCMHFICQKALPPLRVIHSTTHTAALLCHDFLRIGDVDEVKSCRHYMLSSDIMLLLLWMKSVDGSTMAQHNRTSVSVTKDLNSAFCPILLIKWELLIIIHLLRTKLSHYGGFWSFHSVRKGFFITLACQIRKFWFLLFFHIYCYIYFYCMIIWLQKIFAFDYNYPNIQDAHKIIISSNIYFVIHYILLFFMILQFCTAPGVNFLHWRLSDLRNVITVIRLRRPAIFKHILSNIFSSARQWNTSCTNVTCWREWLREFIFV